MKTAFPRPLITEDIRRYRKGVNFVLLSSPDEQYFFGALERIQINTESSPELLVIKFKWLVRIEKDKENQEVPWKIVTDSLRETSKMAFENPRRQSDHCPLKISCGENGTEHLTITHLDELSFIAFNVVISRIDYPNPFS